MKKLLLTLSLAASLATLHAGPQEVAFAGSSFGRSEVKSILENVVGRMPDGVHYVEFGDAIPAEEFKNFGLIVIATGVSTAYTPDEAAIIENYIREGGRLLLIHQAYRSIREAEGMNRKSDLSHFESWLGPGRSTFFRTPVECTVNTPDDPLLTGVFRQNPQPHWLTANILLKNPEFENLIGSDEGILVGRKRIDKGVVYYLGSELFRMKLAMYKDRHADSVSWAQLIENILLDRPSTTP